MRAASRLVLSAVILGFKVRYAILNVTQPKPVFQRRQEECSDSRDDERGYLIRKVVSLENV